MSRIWMSRVSKHATILTGIRHMMKEWEENLTLDALVGYLIFVRALVFEFVKTPLDQISTTSEQLCNFNITSQIDVSNGRQSPELIRVGCEDKVRIWGQITNYVFTHRFPFVIFCHPL